MKKIIFALCIMFYAGNIMALTPELNYFDNIYSNRILENGKILSGKMAIIKINNEAVFCLDPYTLVGTEYDINNSYQLNEKDKEYFELVSYFGYNSEQNTIYDYMAVQELIWERIMGEGKIFWSTEKYGDGNNIDIKEYKDEILTKISEFEKNPSFKDTNYYINSFETLNILDKNKVINNYKFEITGNSKIEVRDNYLRITKDDINDEILTIKRTINNGKTIIYSSSGSQTLGKFGINKTNEMKLNIILDKYKTTLYVKFYDSLTNEKIDNLDYEICNLKNGIKTSKGYKYTNVYEGEYEICNLDQEYINNDLKFKISQDKFLPETYVDIYLYKKNIENNLLFSINTTFNNEKTENNKVINSSLNETISNIDSEIKNQTDNIFNTENSEIMEELPNTYDYETPLYVILSILIIGCALYKIY